MEFWETFVEFAKIATTLIVAAGGSHVLINWIKGNSIGGGKAKALAWGVGAVAAMLSAVAAGQIDPAMFDSPSDWVTAVVSVIGGAEFIHYIRKNW